MSKPPLWVSKSRYSGQKIKNRLILLFTDPYRCCSREDLFRFVHRRQSYRTTGTGTPSPALGIWPKIICRSRNICRVPVPVWAQRLRCYISCSNGDWALYLKLSVTMLRNTQSLLYKKLVKITGVASHLPHAVLDILHANPAPRYSQRKS